MAILTGISSSRTRVKQLTIGSEAEVPDARVWHLLLAGVDPPAPAAAVKARRASKARLGNIDTLTRDFWPKPRVRVTAADCAHGLMGAVQLLGQNPAAQRRQQDLTHFARAQRPALPLLDRLVPLALPSRPPILAVVTPIPAAAAAISIRPGIDCSEAVAVAAGALGWRGAHGYTACPAPGG